MYTIATRRARKYLLSATLGMLTLSGCAAHEHLDLPAPINIPDIAVPDVTPPDITLPGSMNVDVVDTNYNVTSLAFHLTSTSRAGVKLGVPPLETTTRTFYELFGELPPPIAIVVIDTTNPLVSVPAESAAPHSRTITLIGAGLNDTSGFTRTGFQKTLTTLAAGAWVGAYANAWSDALASEGLLTLHARTQNGGKGPGLPDWLHAAAIHLLADSSAAQESVLAMKRSLSRAVPLRTLFTFQLPELADGDLEDLLGASSTEEGLTQSDIVASPTRRATMLFLTEATSVLEYLRATRGTCISAELLVPLLSGWSMSDVLANEPNPTTVDALDADWRRWVSAGAAGTR